MLTTRIIRKAITSNCKYKVGCIGLDKKGDVVAYSYNRPRFKHEGGSIHAEMDLMARYGQVIKTIIICRVTKTGIIKPIHPCKTCQDKADELGIKIVSISDK